MSNQSDSCADVLVIGGGLAGIAATVALAEHGLRITLIESRDRLGGRAGSFVEQHSQETVDNCQHVTMGCCTNLQQLSRKLGVEHHLNVAPRLTFIDRSGRRSHLTSSPLPAPLHLAPSLARMSSLRFTDRLRLIAGIRRLARWRPSIGHARTIDDWLTEARQTPALIQAFWEPVLVSALGETLHRISVGYARKVIVDAFLRNRHGWEVSIPAVPLDDLYGRPVIDWLGQHGGEVRLLTGLKSLEGDVNAITAARLRSGESLRARDFLLALPHYLIGRVLPEPLAAHPSVASLSRLETAPISSLHLWFDREVIDLPHAVLLGRTGQWIFQRPASSHEDAPGTIHYQVVISASRSLEGRPAEDVRNEVLAELAELWPEATTSHLHHWRLVTERRAVFSVTPGSDGVRPPQQSPVPNLQFAGDWTRTGWPATMEGAVRSGLLAAENILQRQGHRVSLLAPDLPTSPLSRWLFGL